MVLNGNDFLAQLLETFRGEAEEHLSEIAAGLLILERTGISPEEYNTTIEQVFRETHSLKGAARAVGLRDIELLCQHQESVLSAVKKGTLTLQSDSYDLFHAVIAALERLLNNDPNVKIADLIQKLRTLSLSALAAPAPERPTQDEPKQEQEKPDNITYTPVSIQNIQPSSSEEGFPGAPNHHGIDPDPAITPQGMPLGSSSDPPEPISPEAHPLYPWKRRSNGKNLL
jgi:two-component system, chemotaxis family, sensor kinase CheA